MSHNLNIASIRGDFPILNEVVNGKQLVYFDNAATTQKPRLVLDALSGYYEHYNANIHRGIHHLAEKATSAFEQSRRRLQAFLNAEYPEEIIFTYGTTDGINLVASAYGRKFLKEGDEIIISTMEHHSNIVPWQMLCEEKGCILKVIPINDEGELLMDEYEKLLTERTKFVSVVHVSNALGTINPIKEIIAKAHAVGAKVLIDGAQASSHIEIDVQDLDCDFYSLSLHKIYGPTGMGILYGKRDLLNAMPPYRGGGEMIKEVTFAKTTYNELPYKFEAGTPNIADVVAAKFALDYVDALGKPNIAAYENELLAYATEAVKEIDGLRIIGQAKDKVSVLSFVIDGIHHQDIGVLLDQQGIAVRTGHHCTQPLMNRFGITGTSRASFAVYNTTEEIDKLVQGLHKVKRMLG
ncbi:cysteine desulfurase/selenocysteine lyase [Dyadobacter sp. BE34]|uniref:Probable cysteine desulfurase n=1 Tax=Dyadobacter fermentans TaxID=94254 RepID=A0ABU1R868_9BACT|nr:MULTISPECIES: cysteine desulfurase [Dyadobacter]MDR6809135.1 cysteine desulfurase/selenocysteine lyase [Dyadobacter fermentans]MDR7046878.1 cysteine desulfurase/selenocysteine lyase [Dyadobacter sp. BE242]MDR7201192.1 cysteine desulfurase/selenocysteine lyase [Dyadobacter sp. BE34]MDR7219152.1 cysteine desulfurase/selenocysteine lyase [Dyadobacter sp. BE31]MDR7264638.1 cysteine desulfurase/selenocysteine lyase [Dyadobacter sp. BE32]